MVTIKLAFASYRFVGIQFVDVYLKTVKFLSEWKKANVIQIHKKVVSQLLKTIGVKILEYLISRKQSDFKPGAS